MGSYKTYHDQKRRDLCRSQGISLMLDAAPLQRRIRNWVDSGILFKDIAERAGVSKSYIQQHYRGVTPDGEPLLQARRASYDRVMGTTFARSEIQRFPAAGLRRRLRALTAMGYSTHALGRMLDRDNRQVSQWIIGKDAREFFSAGNGRKVLEVYEKYSASDPEELGEPGFAMAYTRNRARKLGYAPPGCWDADTIDDPEAVPEWTGACGTGNGWRIHRREGIEPCAPCRRAKQEERTGKVSTVGLTFDLPAFQRARERSGYSRAGLSVAAGLDPATVQGWEAETRRPTPRTLEMVARVLDATTDDFYMEET